MIIMIVIASSRSIQYVRLRVYSCVNAPAFRMCVLRVLMFYSVKPQEDEMLSEPLCTVLSNNHNFHLTGKWYDEKCDEGGYGFICQKPQGRILLVSLPLF